MARAHPHHVTPEELMAYVDGEVAVETGSEIEGCSECSAAAAEYSRFQVGLRQRLYRFDCPSAHRLGDYALDHLEPAERTAVAAHVVDCQTCKDDLQALRTYVAADLSPSQPQFGASVRRVLAQLIGRPPVHLSAPALRDAEIAPVQVYETDAIRVSLMQTPSTTVGAICLDGLVGWRTGAQEPVALAQVQLAAADGAPLSTQTDVLGNFEYDELIAGTYRLELALADDVVVIDDLYLGP